MFYFCPGKSQLSVLHYDLAVISDVRSYASAIADGNLPGEFNNSIVRNLFRAHVRLWWPALASTNRKGEAAFFAGSKPSQHCLHDTSMPECIQYVRGSRSPARAAATATRRVRGVFGAGGILAVDKLLSDGCGGLCICVTGIAGPWLA